MTSENSLSAPVVVWFRQDLRLADNPAYAAAVQSGRPVLAVFVLDDEWPGEWGHGAAARAWLHRSLDALNASLNGRLALYAGDAGSLIPEIARETGAVHVYWNRCYEPWRIERDSRIKRTLENSGTTVSSYNGCLLYEPWNTLKQDGTPYTVFTPFFKKGCLARNGDPPPPPAAPSALPSFHPPPSGSRTPEDLGLLPSPRWDRDMFRLWTPGEAGAQNRLDDFLQHLRPASGEGRDQVARESVSRLSPHLRWGEISPSRIWHRVRERMAENPALEDSGWRFLAELCWREFSYNLLYHFPEMATQPLQAKFAAFDWREDREGLKAWQRGRTGFPIVDAGMRQLWEEGYMHNRVRMIAASFLVKDLRIHWREGERWFWDCLFDADMANNTASWQWVAGCGADAAPYFRIFNPVTQARKFDPDGLYIRRYVPELAEMPAPYIHAPWEAPEHLRPPDYPPPMVDHALARQEALDAFARIRA